MSESQERQDRLREDAQLQLTPHRRDLRRRASGGNLLLTLRRGQKLSQMELAAKAGVAWTTVQAIERGRRDPSIRSLGKICAALELGRTMASQLLLRFAGLEE